MAKGKGDGLDCVRNYDVVVKSDKARKTLFSVLDLSSLGRSPAPDLIALFFAKAISSGCLRTKFGTLPELRGKQVGIPGQ